MNQDVTTREGAIGIFIAFTLRWIVPVAVAFAIVALLASASRAETTKQKRCETAETISSDARAMGVTAVILSESQSAVVINDVRKYGLILAEHEHVVSRLKKLVVIRSAPISVILGAADCYVAFNVKADARHIDKLLAEMPGI